MDPMGKNPKRWEIIAVNGRKTLSKDSTIAQAPTIGTPEIDRGAR